LDNRALLMLPNLHKTLLISVSLCACSSARTDVAATLPGTVFDSVRGVALGMKAKDVRKLRPHTELSPYVGLREKVGDVAVMYSLDGYSYDESPTQHVDESAPLSAVSMTRYFGSFEQANAEWTRDTARLRRSLGLPVSCANLSRKAAGSAAVWEIKGLRMEVYVAGRSDTGNGFDPDRVTHVVRRKGDPMRTVSCD
jgi:hypothetical protein